MYTISKCKQSNKQTYKQLCNTHMQTGCKISKYNNQKKCITDFEAESHAPWSRAVARSTAVQDPVCSSPSVWAVSIDTTPRRLNSSCPWICCKLGTALKSSQPTRGLPPRAHGTIVSRICPVIFFHAWI